MCVFEGESKKTHLDSTMVSMMVKTFFSDVQFMPMLPCSTEKRTQQLIRHFPQFLVNCYMLYLLRSNVWLTLWITDKLRFVFSTINNRKAFENFVFCCFWKKQVETLLAAMKTACVNLQHKLAEILTLKLLLISVQSDIGFIWDRMTHY